MTRHHSLEVKVGAFIVLGIGLLVFFVFAIGDLSSLFQPGYTIRVLFDSANGISEGAPVQYAGVEVGRVQIVRIQHLPDQPAPHVELDVRLPTSVTVRADDVASISTFGLLGEKFLDLSPGPGTGAILEANDQLWGKPPVSTEDLIVRSDTVLAELERTLEGVNHFLADPEARVFFKEAVQEARDATRNWKVLGERLNMAMFQTELGQGTLGKLLYDDELYLRIIHFVDDLRDHPWKLLARPASRKQKNEPKE